jgi:pyruvate dehydrogenase (quinone)
VARPDRRLAVGVVEDTGKPRLRGIFVDHPDSLGGAWDEALASDRPVVLEVRTDPEVPPLPSHITFKQARNFMHALAKGDPNERRVIGGTARQLLGKLFGSRKSDPG